MILLADECRLGRVRSIPHGKNVIPPWTNIFDQPWGPKNSYATKRQTHRAATKSRRLYMIQQCADADCEQSLGSHPTLDKQIEKWVSV